MNSGRIDAVEDGERTRPLVHCQASRLADCGGCCGHFSANRAARRSRRRDADGGTRDACAPRRITHSREDFNRGWRGWRGYNGLLKMIFIRVIRVIRGRFSQLGSVAAAPRWDLCTAIHQNARARRGIRTAACPKPQRLRSSEGVGILRKRASRAWLLRVGTTRAPADAAQPRSVPASFPFYGTSRTR